MRMMGRRTSVERQPLATALGDSPLGISHELESASALGDSSDDVEHALRGLDDLSDVFAVGQAWALLSQPKAAESEDSESSPSQWVIVSQPMAAEQQDCMGDCEVPSAPSSEGQPLAADLDDGDKQNHHSRDKVHKEPAREPEDPRVLGDWLSCDDDMREVFKSRYLFFKKMISDIDPSAKLFKDTWCDVGGQPKAACDVPREGPNSHLNGSDVDRVHGLCTFYNGVFKLALWQPWCDQAGGGTGTGPSSMHTADRHTRVERGNVTAHSLSADDPQFVVNDRAAVFTPRVMASFPSDAAFTDAVHTLRVPIQAQAAIGAELREVCTRTVRVYSIAELFVKLSETFTAAEIQRKFAMLPDVVGRRLRSGQMRAWQFKKYGCNPAAAPPWAAPDRVGQGGDRVERRVAAMPDLVGQQQPRRHLRPPPLEEPQPLPPWRSRRLCSPVRPPQKKHRG